MKTAILLCCSFLILGSLSSALDSANEPVGAASLSATTDDPPVQVEWIWDEELQMWVMYEITD